MKAGVSQVNEMMGPDRKSARRLLVLLTSLTLFWMLSLFLIRTVGFFVRRADSKVFHSLSVEELLAGGLGGDLLLFATALIGLYLLVGGVVWWVTTLIARKHHLNGQVYLLAGLSFWLLSVFWLLLSNGLEFPRSRYTFIVRGLTGTGYAESVSLLAGTLILGLVVYAALLQLRGWLPAVRKRPTRIGAVAVGLALLLAIPLFFPAVPLSEAGASNRPNIIVIGVDSLRLDHVGYFTAGEGSTPAIDDFLNFAAVFPETITPLARTFPAWSSILSGRYPKSTGARYNLIDPTRVEMDENLAWTLKKIDYQTIIAMDERRFANFDASYGFEQEVGPKIGVGDFVLASINDTPLTNRLLDTWLGRLLFPYNYLNRGVSETYQPKSFLDRLKYVITQRDRHKPLFLVTHFCLPHWPYYWSQTSLDASQTGDTLSNRMFFYRSAVAEVDAQFNDLMNALREQGVLENAIVVLLSDHGESHGETLQAYTEVGAGGASTRQGFDPLRMMVEREDWGHGTNILRREQHAVVLGIKGFGQHQFPPGRRSQRASLIDIAPTLYSLVGIKRGQVEFDGRSLVASLETPSREPIERSFYLESGFSVPAIISIKPDMEVVMAQGLRHYAVNRDNGRLEVSKKSHHHIIESKQRGVLIGDWLMFAVKGKGEDDSQLVGLLNEKTREWTTALDSEFARKAPLRRLQKALVDFYGDEAKFDFAGLPERLAKLERQPE
ncbi:sulfatase-like hydrolase/transferase [Candidatus Endoriftia persephone]|uniref:Sulfatase-like hydrolase/transferase n=1 Tax=Candidatus Endoriftia persephonae TaxID=393765 RepID=A0A9J6ZX48_9GAMM|nr:sulfatase-like hydrolase/transferase [Candidatus Endoriftia persephone]USF87269.1 sulfatase-like hydrolase/transferase [Candidatus Endoriftia persephone]